MLHHLRFIKKKNKRENHHQKFYMINFMMKKIKINLSNKILLKGKKTQIKIAKKLLHKAIPINKIHIKM